jgi:acetyl-CoA carboxylase carboxyl transferase subunit beta
VIEQTIRQKLPEGFQRAEFQLDKGMVDMVIDRRQIREELASLLSILMSKRVSAYAEPDLELLDMRSEPQSLSAPQRRPTHKQPRAKAAE